jgi:hypothetical protein
MNLNVCGLILDFVGVIILLYVSVKSKGATTIADENFIISPWIQKVGYVLLAIGFLMQIMGNFQS